ncbi:MAG: metallophosphoesterase [Chloroflexota bacterium]|nr:metallophosphoesterase [Chloroflexota bacterium]MDQ5864297.1 metallophosphoesterase [Chloroflexota bacterium]
MYKLLNLIDVALHVIGYTVAGVFVANTRLMGWEAGKYKPVIVVAHLLLWPLVGFARSFGSGGFWAFLRSLLLPFSRGWLSRALFVGLGTRYLAQEVYRRTHPRTLPSEVLSGEVEDADLTSHVLRAGLPDNLYMRLVPPGLNHVFRLQVSTYTVSLNNLPPQFDGFSIVQLSDFHHGGFTSEEFVRCVVEKTLRLSPDLVVLTGDTQTEQRDIEDIARLLAPLGEWSRRERGGLGVLAVLGNHDRFDESPAHVTDALRRAGIRVLHNEHVALERQGEKLYVAGVADPWSQRADMDLALHGIPPGSCTLLLCHVPDYLVTASRYPVALMLSGHNHGGQIKLPLIGPVLVSSRYNRRYAEGFHKLNDTLMYISNGLGGYPPIRWGARPEIARIVVRTMDDGRWTMDDGRWTIGDENAKTQRTLRTRQD